MIILGVVLLLIGLFAKISSLVIGIILLVVGAVVYLLGSTGRPVGGVTTGSSHRRPVLDAATMAH
jgi:uncharacterized membrane protein YphA (DoxX/SURF4 family)